MELRNLEEGLDMGAAMGERLLAELVARCAPVHEAQGTP